MHNFPGNLVTWLVAGWLAGMGNVMAQEEKTALRPDPGEQFSGQTLVCRPGAEAGEFQIFHQRADGSVEEDPVYLVKNRPELGEVEVYLRAAPDYPRFHIMVLADQSIRVFGNDEGRRHQYPSFTAEPEAGKKGSFSVYPSKATETESVRSAVIEIDNEKKETRVYRTLGGGEKNIQADKQILHSDLQALRRFRIRGMDLKTLTGVVGAVDLLK